MARRYVRKSPRSGAVVRGSGAYASGPRKAYRRKAGPVVRGRGAYTGPTSGPFANAGRAIYNNRRLALPALGGVVGGIAGGPAGIIPGMVTGAGLSKTIFGSGSYSANRTGVSSDQVPYMHSTSDAMRVRHREFICDISSSAAFTVQSFPINPGISTTFPWLANIAINFEQYDFQGLVFEYKTTSVDSLSSTNTALGTVVMAAEYNAASPPYISKQQMEQAMWAVSCKPSESAQMYVECAKTHNTLGIQYIRNGGVISGQDIRMFDLANFEIATSGQQNVNVIGELWVSYDVVLSKPQVIYGTPYACLSAHYRLNAPSGIYPLGSSRNLRFDNMVLTLTNHSITFPAYICGQFLLSYVIIGYDVTVVSPIITVSNCTLVPLFNADTFTIAQTTASAGQATFMMNMVVNVPLSNQPSIIDFGTGGTLPDGTVSGDLHIAQYNSRVVD